MSSNAILRVFPRATAATPNDKFAYVGPPPFPILRDAGGWSTRRAQRKLGVYVLCSYAGDSEADIEERLR